MMEEEKRYSTLKPGTGSGKTKWPLFKKRKNPNKSNVNPENNMGAKSDTSITVTETNHEDVK